MGYDYIWGDDDGNPATPEVIVDSTAVYRGVYDPSIRELSQYRLVIIASDDRGNINGVDFAGEPPYTGYNSLLSSYLDVGGKVFMLGSSALMGKQYTSPNQLPVHQYMEPYRYVFDNYAAVGQGISGSTEGFFSAYFGIYSMTFPEQKTAYVENVPNPALQNADYKYSDNHDFIGTTIYEHISDSEGFKELEIDSVKVNDTFFDRGKSEMTYKYALKDNGTVFTGVPTFESFKGEVVYRYKSIYDLPKTDYNSDLAFEYNETTGDTLFHSLLWRDVETDETGPVLRRSGSVATRYIAEGENGYKTAFFAVPTFYLDNSENQVSDMFKAMIDWFDINNDGGTK